MAEIYADFAGKALPDCKLVASLWGPGEFYPFMAMCFPFMAMLYAFIRVCCPFDRYGWQQDACWFDSRWGQAVRCRVGGWRYPLAAARYRVTN